MVAYTTRMPLGFPGRIARSDSKTIETAIIDSNTPPTIYGQAVKLVAGLLQPVVSGAAADVDGILVCPYPVQSSANTMAPTAPTPPVAGLVDVLRRGYIVVSVARGTPVAGGPVALRVTAGSFTAGEWEGDTTNVSGGDTNCVTMTNAYWMGPKDANGLAEMAYNI